MKLRLLAIASAVLVLLLLWRSFGPQEVVCHGCDKSERRVRALMQSGFLFYRYRPKSREAVRNELMGLVQLSNNPLGFAARCDWVFGTRYSLPLYHQLPFMSSWGDPKVHPRTVFVRSELLQLFHDRVFPWLEKPYVLITGDSDFTVPQQWDARGPSRLIDESSWNALLSSPMVLHIFCEHLTQTHAKVSPIPVGLNHNEFPRQQLNFLHPSIVKTTDFGARLQLKALQCDRIRDGPQYDRRRKVLELCNSTWRDFCVSRPSPSFFDTALEFPFVLCVNGGGIDPNPKAWEALLAGAIPIIMRFPGDSIYSDLPVAYVDDWTPDAVTVPKLQKWLQELAPFFEGEKRQQVIKILHADYWWAKVEAKLRP